MALTEIKTSGIADDAITTDKLANAINTERTANTAKPTLANDANNRVVTGDGSGGLNGEANLTFDGSKLLINTTTEGHSDADDLTIETSSGYCGITLRSPTDTGGAIYFSDATSGAAEYDGQVLYSQNSQTMTLATGGTGRLNILNTGNIEITNGDIVVATNEHGITFETSNNNGFAGTSSLLNDYEEGTWTPGISFGGGTTGITYNTSGSGATGGKYTKIGNQVTVSGNIVLTSKGSAGGAANITGLPFPDGSTADTGRASGSIGRIGNFSTGSPMQLLTAQGASTIRIRRIETDWDDSENVTDADFTDAAFFFFSMTYFA